MSFHGGGNRPRGSSRSPSTAVETDQEDLLGPFPRRRKPAKRFSKEAVNFLVKYDWPGNVRELENLVERLSTIVKRSVIHTNDITQFSMGLREPKGIKLKDAVSVFEKKYIAGVLESVEGNRQKAAELLGIHRNTLLAKISGHGQKEI